MEELDYEPDNDLEPYWALDGEPPDIDEDHSDDTIYDHLYEPDDSVLEQNYGGYDDY